MGLLVHCMIISLNLMHDVTKLQVKDCRVVIDPRTKESRGFAFVTMENVEDARRCIKYLHRTVLEGRLISVAKV